MEALFIVKGRRLVLVILFCKLTDEYSSLCLPAITRYLARLRAFRLWKISENGPHIQINMLIIRHMRRDEHEP